MRNSILFILIIFVTQLKSQSQIHCIHGLGGEGSKFDEILDVLEEHCLDFHSTQEDYTSEEGILVQGSEVMEVLVTQDLPGKSIAIGASFGGVVLRHLASGNNPYFDGMITIGSQHLGAKLANSTLNGDMERYLEGGCDALLAKPARAYYLVELLDGDFALGQTTFAAAQAIGYSVLCDGLFEIVLVLNRILGGITGSDLLTIKDIVLDGRAANLPLPTMPNVSISTHVESPIHWNLIGDETGNDIAQQMADMQYDYSTLADANAALAASLVAQWWNPYSWNVPLYRASLLHYSRTLSDGALWIEESEDTWNVLIGADTGGHWVSNNVQVTVPMGEPCFSDGECEPGQSCINQWCTDNANDLCSSGSTIETITLKKWESNAPIPSDGLVIVPSQTLETADAHYHVSGVSHWQQSRDPKVHDLVKIILSNETIHSVFDFGCQD